MELSPCSDLHSVFCPKEWWTVRLSYFLHLLGSLLTYGLLEDEIYSTSPISVQSWNVTRASATALESAHVCRLLPHVLPSTPEVLHVGPATQGSMTQNVRNVVWLLCRYLYFLMRGVCVHSTTVCLLSIYNPCAKCRRWAAPRVTSLGSAVCWAAAHESDAGIGAAFLEVVPTWEGGARVPSEGGGKAESGTRGSSVRCPWSLAKQGLGRLNPQGCGMPMEDCGRGVISHTGWQRQDLRQKAAAG